MLSMPVTPTHAGLRTVRRSTFDRSISQAREASLGRILVKCRLSAGRSKACPRVTQRQSFRGCAEPTEHAELAVFKADFDLQYPAVPPKGPMRRGAQSQEP